MPGFAAAWFAGQVATERWPSQVTVVVDGLPAASASVAFGIAFTQWLLVQIRSLPEITVTTNCSASTVTEQPAARPVDRLTCRLSGRPTATVRATGTTDTWTAPAAHRPSSRCGVVLVVAAGVSVPLLRAVPVGPVLASDIDGVLVGVVDGDGIGPVDAAGSGPPPSTRNSTTRTTIAASAIRARRTQ